MATESATQLHQRIAASFDRQGLMRHLDARLTQVQPGEVHIQLPQRAEVSQQHGYFHATISKPSEPS